jgi:hypothetical protein
MRKRSALGWRPSFSAAAPGPSMRQPRLVDAHAALWLFTTNGSYYTGTAARTEAPIGALQAHISYAFSFGRSLSRRYPDHTGENTTQTTRSSRRIRNRSGAWRRRTAIIEAGKDTGHPTDVQWIQGVSSFQ